MFKPKKTLPVVQEVKKVAELEDGIVEFGDDEEYNDSNEINSLEKEKQELEKKLAMLESNKKEQLKQKSVTLNRKVIVVKEIPVREVREATLEDGSRAELVTIEEALTELLEAYRNQN
jgi:hypothetical protein